MANLNELRCWNSNTGKRDGGYCVWEGKGKCLKCEAADRIEQLQADNDALHEATDQDQELNASLSKRIEQLEGEKEIFTDFEQQARWVEYKKWKVIIKDLKQKASQLAPPKG